RRWAAMIVSLCALIMPLFLQPQYWQEKLPGTALNNPQLFRTPGEVAFHFGSNLFYALFEFLAVPAEHGFVVMAYVDSLTAVLVLVGMGYLVAHLRRDRFAAFFALAFAALLFAVGAS